MSDYADLVKRLYSYADAPRAYGCVPISPTTLRECADAIADLVVARAVRAANDAYVPRWRHRTTARRAACAEERRAALTEAAEACRIQRIPNKSPASEIEAYNEGCYDCGTAIERLRDKAPPTLTEDGKWKS